MAEAVSLGASIIAFVAVAARLSKAVNDTRDSVKDAPEDIARVVKKLGNLDYLLNEIHNQDTSTANSQAGDSLRRLWASQSGQLQRDFASYQALADKLALQLRKDQGPISGAKIRFHWFFKRDAVRELDDRLQENIELFEMILGLLTYNIVRSSSFDLQGLRSVGAQSVESINNLEPIIEQAFASWKSDFSQSLQQAFPLAKGSNAGNATGSTVSTCFNRWYTYTLPFGTLRVTKGVKKLAWNKSWRYDPSSGSTDEETTSGIMFDFCPAPWLMAKAVVGTFVLHHRKYNDLPGLTYAISTANVLPKRHQALIAVKGGNIPKLQELFSRGLAAPNDRETVEGKSLLHLAAASCHYEMCALLIREGADCNAADDLGRTPLHDLFNEQGEIDQTVALLDLHVKNGADLTILSRHGVSSFTYPLVERLEFSIWDDYPEISIDFRALLKFLGDFGEIDGFDPTPLAMSLCAVHSGDRDVAAKVEPAVKKWLETHHKQGFMDLGDADALRVLAFQALQYRAPELAASQAEIVLRFAFLVRCSLDVIRALVRPGTVNGDSDSDGSQGIALLNLAAARGDLEAVDILLDAGADDQAQNLTAFESALERKHYHVVERFLGRFFGREDIPIMALNLAIKHGTLDLVKRFLGRIPVPDLSARLVGNWGPSQTRSIYANRTVLFTAAWNGEIEIVKLLIERGIDVLARDTKGRTASVYCRARHKDISEYLEQEENKVRLKNKLNDIPNDPELASLAALATAAPRRDPHHELPFPRGRIDPDFGTTEGIDGSQSVHHVLDSWGSLKVLTTEDVALIVSGLCVALAGASYVFLAEGIRFAWQNRQYVTVRNVKRVGWFVSLVLSLACYIGYAVGEKR